MSKEGRWKGKRMNKDKLYCPNDCILNQNTVGESRCSRKEKEIEEIKCEITSTSLEMSTDMYSNKPRLGMYNVYSLAIVKQYIV